MRLLFIFIFFVICSIQGLESAGLVNSFQRGLHEKALREGRVEVAQFIENTPFFADGMGYQDRLDQMLKDRYKNEVYRFMGQNSRDFFDRPEGLALAGYRVAKGLRDEQEWVEEVTGQNGRTYILIKRNLRAYFYEMTKLEFEQAGERARVRCEARELFYAMQTAMTVYRRAVRHNHQQTIDYSRALMDRLYARKNSLPTDAQHQFNPSQWALTEREKGIRAADQDWM